MKIDVAVQFEPTKNANIFKDFYSDLAGKIVGKFPITLKHVNNNSTKQYRMNIEKSSHSFKLCNPTLETIKKILVYLDSSKAFWFGFNILKFFERWRWEVLALPLRDLVNLSIKQSLFPDQVMYEHKCHGILSSQDSMHVNIGTAQIENSKFQKFEDHINRICKKASVKLNALSTISYYMDPINQRLLVNAFFTSQFNYCPLTWMFHINSLRKRYLRLVLQWQYFFIWRVI